MKSFLDPGRRRSRRLGERFRGRFDRGQATGSGGPGLIRYRRNRELLAREGVSLVLWLILAGMLLSLARTISRALERDSELLGPGSGIVLPLLPVLACLGCLWRARRAWAELRDIRVEQRTLIRTLREENLES